MTWQDAPGWSLAEYDADYWRELGRTPPPRPTAEAEQAQPPVWATLYDRRRPVATWFLNPGMTSPDPDATLVP